jgi:hypothetical protein
MTSPSAIASFWDWVQERLNEAIAEAEDYGPSGEEELATLQAHSSTMDFIIKHTATAYRKEEVKGDSS